MKDERTKRVPPASPSVRHQASETEPDSGRDSTPGVAVGLTQSPTDVPETNSRELPAAEKFSSLRELLADPMVMRAIAALPAGSDVEAGQYYAGLTPIDVTGTWTTEATGGQRGLFASNGAPFGGTFVFTGMQRGVFERRAHGINAVEDGTGSYVVGQHDNVTLFSQITWRSTFSTYVVRIVEIARFNFDHRAANVLRNYYVAQVLLGRYGSGIIFTCGRGPFSQPGFVDHTCQPATLIRAGGVPVP